MPTFFYEARDRDGRPHQGTIVASDPRQAYEQLRQQGLWVTRLKEQTDGRPKFTLVKVEPEPMAIFFRHLNGAMRAGMGLSEALTIFAQTERRSPLRAAAQRAADLMAQGIAPSKALAESGYPFPPFVLAMVEVGEKSGNLDDVFQLLAQHFERENEFRQELRRATMYPRFLFAFAIVLILIVAFVMPVVMEKLLRAKGETEPFLAAHYGAATRKMLPIATLIALGFLGRAVWRFLTRQPIFAPLVETIRLSLPWVGNLPRLLAAARFARALAMMVGAGMELSHSVELAADAAGSPQLQTAARQHAPRLQKGEPLSAVLMDLPLLHPMVVRIVATGEKTGTIDEGLTKAAEFLESEALTAIRAQADAAYFVCFFLAAIAIFLAVARFWMHWYGGMVEAVDKFMGVDQ